MDESRARELLQAERTEVESLIAENARYEQDDRAAEDANDAHDEVDAAQPLVSEALDDAVEQRLRDRLAAVERAEQRLAEGTYGLSVRSGEPIPDARLEVQPTAELTVEEASEGS